jgi:putative two-component system response regulator
VDDKGLSEAPLGAPGGGGRFAAARSVRHAAAGERRAAIDHETILIVDDAPDNLAILGELLREAGYHVKVANSGGAGLRLAELAPRPALIVLDVMMPGVDGYEVLRGLRGNPLTCDIPVIFLTVMDTAADEERAFAAGISDYITKPIKPAVVLARIRSQLLAREARHGLQGHNQALEAEIAHRLRENEQIQIMSMRALAHLAETRDNETGFHIQRTQGFVRELAARLQSHPRFARTLTPEYINLLSLSAPLHDIGKVGIPDRILLKRGKLNADEWEVMKTHTVLGSEAIAQAQTEVDAALGFLTQAKEIARWHHERWDGSGYPDGLAGEAIPLAARLMAIADVFDALISKRCYKKAVAFDEVRTIITAGRGTHFDPDIADAFVASFDDFTAIAIALGGDEASARPGRARRK